MFTDLEKKQLIEFIDIGIRAQGASVAEAGLNLIRKISALPNADESDSPAPEVS